jgi:DivIVA domain-containing protein
MREASNEGLENTTFSTALRGYDRDEVDEFVRTVAQEMRELHQGRNQKMYESLGEEMGTLLQHARDSADEMSRRAQEQAAATRAGAEAEAQRIREEAEARARELQKRAEQKAAEVRAAAERDASARLAEATKKVSRLEATEGQARNRIRALHEELASITKELQSLQNLDEDDTGEEQVAESPEKDRESAPARAAQTKEQTQQKTPEMNERERKRVRLEPEQERVVRQ